MATYSRAVYSLDFREAIQQQINNGDLASCRLNVVNTGPRGPHPVGSYETCCNSTSIPFALSFFMQNHGNLSVLLHPLTRMEVLDHTKRAMFLGPKLPLDTSVLAEDLGENLDICRPFLNQEPQVDAPRALSVRSGFHNWFLPLNWSTNSIWSGEHIVPDSMKLSPSEAQTHSKT